MRVSHPFSDRLSELIAARFRVLSDPMRIRLVDRLREGEASVGELVEATGGSQQNVSKHLGILLGAGILARRQQGNLAYYRIVDESVFELCERVCGSIERRLEELTMLIAGES
ncbi:MAG: ArsR/SmtB family transcription factor [Gaiellaceae bacterium]